MVEWPSASISPFDIPKNKGFAPIESLRAGHDKSLRKEMNDFRPLDVALLCFPGCRYLLLVRNKCAIPVLKVGGGLWSLNQISQALSLIFDVILIQVSAR
jgi:hypothetical protein